MLSAALRWIGPPASPESSGLSLVERVLAARSVSREQWDRLRNPALTDLREPSSLPGLDAAADRVMRAIAEREPIAIYGDYDVDGVTATAILARTIAAIEPAADVRTYIPHRLEEGYGLNAEALAWLADQGVRVVVTVDCGVTAVAAAARARALGLDLVITDHHEPPARGDDLPQACAIAHPRLPGVEPSHPDLAGAGVAHKLAWRLAALAGDGERAQPEHRRLLIDLLALAALGTIADVVSLTEDSRVIARFGLRRMRSTSFVGLNALIAASGLAEEDIDAERVGFILGPRLNAVGRLGHAREALELLLTDDPRRADEIARALSRVNDERRRIERDIFEQASAAAQAQGMTGDGARAIALASDDWHPGVVGVACSRLVERHSRPALLLCGEGALYRGSGRSVPAFNLHAALAECSEHLESFGGHAMAAGLSLKRERFEDFAGAFLEVASARLTPADLERTLDVDCEAQVEELTKSAVQAALDLGPFGAGNPRPALLIRGARLAAAPRVMGARGAHLCLTMERKGGRGLRLVGWGMGARAERVRQGQRLDVVITPRLNAWNGRVSVEGELRDMRSAGAPAPGCATASSPS